LIGQAQRRRVERLLSQIRSCRSVAGRVDVLSRHFLGRPYTEDPLIGSARTPEVFTASLNAFDCVTYIETILALARSGSYDEFAKWLRKIRYEHGRVAWNRRNHYISDWIRSNAREGIVRPVPLPAGSVVVRERVLNLLPELPVQKVQVKAVPKGNLHRLEGSVRTSDLIFFASTRKNLDVFHGGIVIRNGKRLLLRHAVRSRGFVVEQDLKEFLQANRMAGVILIRPVNI
jgi:hypothetical protein